MNKYSECQKKANKQTKKQSAKQINLMSNK